MHDHFVGGGWIRGRGEPLVSTNPSTGEEVLRTKHATSLEVEGAFTAGAKAFPNWANQAFAERIKIARRFAEIAQARREEFGQAIAMETGKPRWEANQEVDTVVRKIDLSIEAYGQRTGTKSEVSGNGRSELAHAPHRFAGRPDVILALEMGGNNPLVVLDGADPVVAARIIATSAFISAGQRCTCSRRLILVQDDVLSELIRVTEEIRVGSPDEVPPPFIGPLINSAAAQKVLHAQEQLIERGGGNPGK